MKNVTQSDDISFRFSISPLSGVASLAFDDIFLDQNLQRHEGNNGVLPTDKKRVDFPFLFQVVSEVKQPHYLKQDTLTLDVLQELLVQPLCYRINIPMNHSGVDRKTWTSKANVHVQKERSEDCFERCFLAVVHSFQVCEIAIIAG